MKTRTLTRVDQRYGGYNEKVTPFEITYEIADGERVTVTVKGEAAAQLADIIIDFAESQRPSPYASKLPRAMEAFTALPAPAAEKAKDVDFTEDAI